MSVCKKEICTGCGVCIQVCPQKCIEKVATKDGNFYYSINEQLCIQCGRCKRVCPNLNEPVFNKNEKSFAAWRTNLALHMESASGGLATAFYEYAAKKQMYFAGVALDDKFEAHFTLGHNIEDIAKYKNSKYTFSFASDVYGEIIDKLKHGRDIVFIGLPCQVAGLKNLVRINKITGKLITIDLVCHGTPSPMYLQQHIKAIEQKYNQHYVKCHFRDAKFDTSNFAYTLYTHNSSNPEYIKFVDENDNYQIGYHNALIYRDVCYNCKYARRERVGDLTIGDYHGLGKLAPYFHEKINVSCLIVNSETGKRFIDEVKKEIQLTLYERPLNEPMEGERQFNHPSIAPPERKIFIENYKKSQDFETAANVAFKKYKRRNFIQKLLHIKQFKNSVMKVIPRGIKEQIKSILRKMKGPKI